MEMALLKSNFYDTFVSIIEACSEVSCEISLDPGLVTTLPLEPRRV